MYSSAQVFTDMWVVGCGGLDMLHCFDLGGAQSFENKECVDVRDPFMKSLKRMYSTLVLKI